MGLKYFFILGTVSIKLLNLPKLSLIQALLRSAVQLYGMYEDVVNSGGSIWTTVSFFGGNLLALIINDCPLLMFHLGNYSISHNIKLLRSQLTSNRQSDLPWIGSKQVLLHLYKASAALCSAFSLPVLYIITSKLISISFLSFLIICGLVQDNSLFETHWILVMLVEVVINLANVLVVLHAADMPVNQVINTTAFKIHAGTVGIIIY